MTDSLLGFVAVCTIVCCRTEDDEARALATTSDISSLTDSDQQKEDDSNFSNVTSVTLDSALLNQQSKVPSQIQDALPVSSCFGIFNI